LKANLTPMLHRAMHEESRRPNQGGDMITRPTLHELLTGKVAEPTTEIRVRAFQVQKIVRTIKQLKESPHVNFECPTEIYNRGYTAIVSWLYSEITRAEALKLDPVTEDIESETLEDTHDLAVAIWYKSNDRGWIKAYSHETKTINDTIRDILDAYGVKET
jgi:hypothetical protein